MGEELRGGRARETDWASRTYVPLGNRAQEDSRPQLVESADLDEKDEAFLAEVRESIDFKTVSAIAETMLAKSDVSDPHIRSHPSLSYRFTPDSESYPAYESTLDTIAFNPDFMAAQADLFRVNRMRVRWKWSLYRMMRAVGLVSKEQLRGRWRETPFMQMVMQWALFHELCHGISRVRLDKQYRDQELGYRFIRMYEGLAEGANDLAAFVLSYRYAKAKGVSPQLETDMSHVIHYSPYLLNAYVTLLFAQSVAKQLGGDPARITDAIVRGNFNEGYQGMEALLPGVPKEQLDAVMNMGFDREKLLNLARTLGAGGTDTEIMKQARLALMDYVRASAHTSVHAERYSSPRGTGEPPATPKLNGETGF